MKTILTSALLIASLSTLLGCRDGLLQPEAETALDAGFDASVEIDAGYCDPFVFLLSDGAGADETRGTLTNLIAMQASAFIRDGDSVETAVDTAALTVVSRFPAGALPRLEPIVLDAKADALDFLTADNR